MARKPVVLGATVGAAFSTVAIAAPYTQSAPAEQNSTGIVGPPGDVTFAGIVHSSTDIIAAEPSAALDVRLREDSALTGSPQDALAFLPGNIADDRGADSSGDATIFSGNGIKITNLHATMTANRYVASPFAPAAQFDTVDDVKLFAPDYFSVKAMSPLPKRSRSVVGVGLVTVPSSSNVKTSDTATNSAVPEPTTTQPGKK